MIIVPGTFTAHSGQELTWKIECDSLSDDDIRGIAFALSQVLPTFGSVEGVPRGGLRLAEAMRQYATTGALLIVDDVCTTGGSLEVYRAGREAIGAVIFNRGELPDWCDALFEVHP